MWQFKDTAAGKFLAVAMSVILVIGMTNSNAFAYAAGTDEPDTMEVSDIIDTTKVTFDIAEGATVEVAAPGEEPAAVENEDVVEALSHEAFKFTVEAQEGFEVSAIAVNDEAVEIAEDGEYEIAAEDMSGEDVTVKVETEAVPAEEETPSPRQPPRNLPPRRTLLLRIPTTLPMPPSLQLPLTPQPPGPSSRRPTSPCIATTLSPSTMALARWRMPTMRSRLGKA